jgi:hypothetical protein
MVSQSATPKVPDTRTIPTLPCWGTMAVAIAAMVPVVAKISDMGILDFGFWIG